MSAEAEYSFFIDWNDDGDYSDAGENVTARVLGLRQSVGFKYGRDQARALSAIAPGDTQFELLNDDQQLSPDNPSSIYAGNLEPGKPFLIQATYNGTTYDLFRGFLDNYTLAPGRADRSVKMSAVDLLSKFASIKVSTELYSSLQTGEAIGYLLDAMGWPESARDIDAGATTIRWWCEDDTDGLAALSRLVEAEGPPAFAFVGPDGNFVFRDRHHRLTRSASTTSQVTISSGSDGAEPSFATMDYDIGWKDLINDVTVEVSEREPTFEAAVWNTDEVYSIRAGDTLTINVTANDPFYDAVTPEAGTDFTLVSGNVDTVTISRTSGKSLELRLHAAADSVIQGLQLRAKSVPVARTITVNVQDAESISKNQIRTLQDADLNWAGRNDADAIGHIIVGQRAKRVPIVTIGLNSGNSQRLSQILSRDLSDRIHIKEPDETFTDHDFFIEAIEHDIGQVGKDHTARFYCERAPFVQGQETTWFTFDTAGKGFDDGAFASAGQSFATTLLILDDPTKGQLGNNGLGF